MIGVATTIVTAMAFKKTQQPGSVPDSPEKILLDLPRRKIPGVLLHQGEVMQSYRSKAVDATDVALQLPTGSGKTLVGLLIGEWRRRKFGEKVVYLCPTRQLVNQVVEQAADQYGLAVNGFTGQIRNYLPSAKAEFQTASRVAVTTYSSLFNTNPYFSDPDVILVDDAHAAENYIGAAWTLRIERENPKTATFHQAVSNVLRPVVDPTNYRRLMGERENTGDRQWVDKIATPDLAKIHQELGTVIDAHVADTDLRYPWEMIGEHLLACNVYLSSKEILIRPLIPPTWTHRPFSEAKQRIFMSATLGAGGDLERLTGRRKILRIPVPSGWDRQGIGRRFFVFPELGLAEAEAAPLRRNFMSRAGRSVVLVPSDTMAKTVIDDVTLNLNFPVFVGEDIEASKKDFVAQQRAVAVIANRYDGIDFPGDDCRLLFIEGLPKTTNLQERFLMTRMGAGALLNDRIQTRIVQAIGRCTRSLQDFSAVVVSGDELPDYLTDRRHREALHPELQAEIAFGIEQSQGAQSAELLENLNLFLENGEDWDQANKEILLKRDSASQKPSAGLDELQACVGEEIEYQERLWQHDYEAAMSAAESVLGKLTVPELRGYRALWEYLAGSAAFLAAEGGLATCGAKAKAHFLRAKEAARGIPWLVNLARHTSADVSDDVPDDTDQALMDQIERLESVLADLGTVHDRSFAMREKEILEGLAGSEHFEQAQVRLGELLGFEAGKIEADATPDPWWAIGRYYIVFEDHAGAEPDVVLSATKARQVSSHPQWIRSNLEPPENAEIVPVLVTPATNAKESAIPYLESVALWPLAEFREWAKEAVATIRELRRTFSEPGDLAWRAQAEDALRARVIDAPSLVRRLSLKSAKNELVAVK